MNTSNFNLNQCTTWVLTSKGRAGTEIQCVSLAKALKLDPLIKRVVLKFPWTILPEPLWCAPLNAYSKKGDSLSPPWPDILIASGRSAAPVAAKIYHESRQHGRRGTFVIIIQDPRLPVRNFDMVIVPQHSDVHGPNVIETHGSLHNITPQQIQEAKINFSHLQQLPSPRVAVLIGGKNKYYRFSKNICATFVSQLKNLSAQGYSLMISSSRRTPLSLSALLQHEFQNNKNVMYWDGKTNQPNPYHALLGWADFIIVTGDSVSMLTEACATGNPIYIYPLPKKGLKTPRLNRFHKQLVQANAARIFKGQLENFSIKPLNEINAVAQKVLEKLKNHFTKKS